MMTPTQLAELQAFDARGHRILSVYLDVSPQRHLKNALRAAFEDQARELKGRLADADRPAQKAATDEIARVVAALEPMFMSPQGKSVVVFSCTARDLWHLESLPFSVRDHIAFERWADVAPLTAVFDEHERYAVALVDKTHARLFTVFAGAIEARDEHYDDDLPRRHDQGGTAQNRLQRHHESLVHWHVKDVVPRLERMAQTHPFDRLVIAGPVETTTELVEVLPHQLSQRLVGVVPLEMVANEADVLTKTLAVVDDVEREAEERLVNQIVEADAHERGTRGLAPTLRALYLGDVRTLVVADGIAVPGFECTNPLCGLLERVSFETCPACGTAMEPVHDIVHRAMARAFSQDGRVQVVHGAPAKTLERHDGVGALLRFPNPVTAGSL